MSQFLNNSSDFNVITRKKVLLVATFIHYTLSRTLESISFFVFCCTEMSVSILYLSGHFLVAIQNIYSYLLIKKKGRRVCGMVTIS